MFGKLFGRGKKVAKPGLFGATQGRPAVADEAAHYAQNNWAKKLRDLPLVPRMSIIFGVAFSFGFAVETFACKTGLYHTVVHKKTERRHELDEWVVQFREDMQKWTDEDIRLRKEAEIAQQQLAAAHQAAAQKH